MPVEREFLPHFALYQVSSDLLPSRRRGLILAARRDAEGTIGDNVRDAV